MYCEWKNLKLDIHSSSEYNTEIVENSYGSLDKSKEKFSTGLDLWQLNLPRVWITEKKVQALQAC